MPPVGTNFTRSLPRLMILACSCLLPLVAVAQQAEPMLQEVIVTAQKRAANLQEVPFSVSATSQELLKTMNEVNDVAGSTARMATTGQDDLSGMDRTMRLLADSTGSISSLRPSRAK